MCPLSGGEHLPPLGGVLRQRGDLPAAHQGSRRAARRQHPRGLATAHRRTREPRRVCHVSLYLKEICYDVFIASKHSI